MLFLMLKRFKGEISYQNLSQEYVMKDLLVVSFLDFIEKENNKNFIFTGGTSLAKQKIIKRFSEDIDIIDISISKK